MQSLPDYSGSDSESGESNEASSFESASAGESVFNENIIGQANSVPLLKVFKFYSVRLDSYTHKAICPIKRHKGGKERTPSLEFYPETNTFHCHGCKAGVGVVNFVSEMEKINILDAAHKVVHLFESDVDPDSNSYFDPHNAGSTERLEILMEFSNFVRELLISNKNNTVMFEIIETTTQFFDKLINRKKSLSDDALRSLVASIKEQLIKNNF